MYAEDLAHVHHVGFSDFAKDAAPGLLRLFSRHGIRGGRVIDLGCGSGEWLAILAQNGFEAIGVDGSRAFIRRAKRTAPLATVRLGSIWTCKLQRCEAVTALGEVISYVPTPGSRRPSLRNLFGRVRSVLPVGGLFVFDALTAGRQPMSYRSWREGWGWSVLIEVSEDVNRGLMHRTIVTFRKKDGAYRRAVEKHELRVTEKDEVVESLRSTGFDVRTSKSYGTFRLPRRRTVFVARRSR